MINRLKIGLMGGSFDPIHFGHLKIAEAVYYALGLDHVLFIPSGRPPHKAQLGASAGQRLEMTRLSVEDLAWAKECDVEVFRDGTIYTVDTLKILHQQIPSADFTFIIGADTLLDLPNWKKTEEVCKLCSFACVQRPGYALGKDLEKILGLIRERYHAQIFLVEEEGPDLSSTTVRSLIAEGASTEMFLPTKVRQFIDREKLYRI